MNKDGFVDALFGREGVVGTWALSNGRGRFRIEDALPSSRDAVAAQIFDYDNDGLLDLFVVTLSGPHIFRNTGRVWQEESERAISADVGGRPSRPGP